MFQVNINICPFHLVSNLPSDDHLAAQAVVVFNIDHIQCLTHEQNMNSQTVKTLSPDCSKSNVQILKTSEHFYHFKVSFIFIELPGMIFHFSLSVGFIIIEAFRRFSWKILETLKLKL